MIDEKHKSLIAFLGVMITIQITVFPSIAEYFTNPLSVLDYLVCVVFILSLIFYTCSIIYFIYSLQYEEFESVPKTDAIMDYSYDVNCKLSFIIGNTITSFDEALEISKKMDKYAKVLKEDILVARGETKRYIKLDEYGEYRDKAPLSTSLDVTVPLEFGEELSYIILPKGTKVSPLNRISEYDNEMEVLLPENSLLKYIDECPNYDKNGRKSKSAKIFKLITT